MASPSPRSGSGPGSGPKTKTRRTHQPLRQSPLAQQLPLVSGRWLLWSLAGVFGGGLLLVYLTMVLLFWQGQWQILFHPDRTEQPVAATAVLPLEPVAFDTTEVGKPLLAGWYIPATTGRKQATILYLHSLQTGSLAGTVSALTVLHTTGVNVFAFDYRGFGRSDFLHPSEASATEDAEAAWKYLTETRHVPARSIVIYGVGLAASLAADLAANHPDAAGVVFEAPEADALTQLRADPRSRLMPVSLLAHDVFNPDAALAKIKQPKLILITASSTEAGKRYAERAADPKQVVSLPATDRDAEERSALGKFLNMLPSPPSASR